MDAKQSVLEIHMKVHNFGGVSVREYNLSL